MRAPAKVALIPRTQSTDASRARDNCETVSFLYPLRHTILLCAISAAACSSAEDDPDAWGKPHWPTTRTALPACTQSRMAFAEPALAPPSGRVKIAATGRMEPVNRSVRLRIEVRTADDTAVDTTANGPVSITSDAGVTVESTTAIAAGIGEAIVRFTTPGTHDLALSHQGLGGNTAFYAYATQLAVWELTASEADLAKIYATPYEDTLIPARLALDGGAFDVQMRLHGGSSRDFVKKSFRLNLPEGISLPDGTSDVILRAEYVDKTLLRNYLASEVVRNGTWLHGYRTEFVHVRLNQRYYGIMARAERIDADFLRARNLRRSGSLYEADPPLHLANPGANLTPLASRDLYKQIYQHQKGDIDYDDLIHLIERTLQAPEGDFPEALEGAVAVADYLVYIAALGVIQNHDHIRKNYYLYRDPKEDGRWRVIPWDLDLSFGHLWTEKDDVLSEELTTNASLFVGTGEKAGPFNHMMDRLLRVPKYRARYLEFVQHLANDVLSDSFINERIDNALCRATPDILADTQKRATNAEYLSRVEELRTFITARRAFVGSGQ